MRKSNFISLFLVISVTSLFTNSLALASTNPPPQPSPSSTSTPQPGSPTANGLSLGIFQGQYVASSVASGTALSIQITLSEQGIANPPTNEPVTLTFHPANGSADIVKTISLANNFTGCAVSENQCYYDEETISETVSGTLTLSYNGSTASYSSISKYIDIWVPQARTFVDQKDEKVGFQVHAIYVVPSDGVNRARDTSGEISTWLEQGSRWLDSQVGDHWQVDTTKAGIPDVTYFHSKYSSNVLRDVDNGLAGLLSKEMGPKLLPVGSNRKTYLFFIEVPTFVTKTKDADYKGGILCGLSQVDTNPVRMAIVATGAPDVQQCSGHVDTMDWQAAVATHETVHTFGVRHVTTPHDLMLKIPDNNDILLFDPTHTQYFGGNLAGTDLQKLRIWSKNPTDTSATSRCIYEQRTTTYWCGLGINGTINAYPAQCWQHSDSTMVLQVLQKKVWSNVIKAIPQKASDCPKSYPAGYSMTLTGSKVGVGIYRFKASPWTSKPFTIVFQL